MNIEEAYKDLPTDARIKVDVFLKDGNMSIVDVLEDNDLYDLFDLKIEVESLLRVQRQNLRMYKHVEDVCEYAKKTIRECKKWLEKYEKYTVDDEEEQEKCTFNDVIKFLKNDIEQFGVVENRTDDIIYVVDKDGKQHLINDKSVLEIID